MALNGNKPIRLSYTTRAQKPEPDTNGRRVINNNSGDFRNHHISAEKKRRLKIARLRRLRQEKLLKLRSTMTTIPTTIITTTLIPTTTIPSTPETTTFWYDTWVTLEGQSSTPGDLTDSIVDYNYDDKIDNY